MSYTPDNPNQPDLDALADQLSRLSEAEATNVIKQARDAKKQAAADAVQGYLGKAVRIDD